MSVAVSSAGLRGPVYCSDRRPLVHWPQTVFLGDHSWSTSFRITRNSARPSVTRSGYERVARSMRSCTCPTKRFLRAGSLFRIRVLSREPSAAPSRHTVRPLTVREPPCSYQASTATARTTFLPRHTPSRNRRRRSVLRRVILTDLFSRPSEIPASPITAVMYSRVPM
jgi:hypothetical protein